MRDIISAVQSGEKPPDGMVVNSRIIPDTKCLDLGEPKNMLRKGEIMGIKWLLSTTGLLTIFMAVAGVLLALSFRTAFNAVFEEKLKKRLPKEASTSDTSQ